MTMERMKKILKKIVAKGGVSIGKFFIVHTHTLSSALVLKIMFLTFLGMTFLFYFKRIWICIQLNVFFPKRKCGKILIRKIQQEIFSPHYRKKCS